VVSCAPHCLDERGATSTSCLPPAGSSSGRTGLERQPDPPPGAAPASAGEVTSRDDNSQAPRLAELMRDRTPPSGHVCDDPLGTCPACHRLAFPSRAPGLRAFGRALVLLYQQRSTTPAWESTEGSLRVSSERRCGLPSRSPLPRTSAPGDLRPQFRATLARTRRADTLAKQISRQRRGSSRASRGDLMHRRHSDRLLLGDAASLRGLVVGENGHQEHVPGVRDHADAVDDEELRVGKQPSVDRG